MKRAGRVKMHGFKKVERNLQYALSGLNNNATEALVDVARDIHYGANRNSPVIPQNTGDLIRSRFIVDNKGKSPLGFGTRKHFVGEQKKSGGWKKDRSPGEMQSEHTMIINKYKARAETKKHPFVTLGYSAWYGVYPHEMGSVKWTRRGSGPKFFQTALYRKAKELSRKVYEEANLHGNRNPKTYAAKGKL